MNAVAKKLPKIIFDKSYDGESIYDMQRDIVESFNPKFNDQMIGISSDEYGFPTGEFRVNITWYND